MPPRMTVHVSVSVANAALDAITAAWGAKPKLCIYAGNMPVNTSAALVDNTLLAEITPAPVAAAKGTKNVLGETQSVAAAAAGKASFYRVYNAAGTDAYEQGTVGIRNADVLIENTDVHFGQTVKFNSFSKAWPNTP